MQHVAAMQAEGHSSRVQTGGTLPLSMAGGGRLVVRRVKGDPEQKRFLECLGFVEGATISVVNQSGGNLIVEAKGARVALSSQMAVKILVTPE